MAIAKSPFKIYQQFLSPKLCEHICDSLGFDYPDEDKDGNLLRLFKHNEVAEKIIFERLQPLIPELEQYYDIQYKGTEQIMVEWFTEGVVGKPQCENSQYLKQKWVRTLSRDLTAILFLSDYQDTANFDSDYEVYGGKLEFPQHNFGFNPERGTLIVYPSVPHFINATAEIKAGELYQARIQIAATAPFLYQPSKFPGTYVDWFKEELSSQ
jgi:hypothetical protein